MQGTAVMTYGQISGGENCIGRGQMNTHGQLEKRSSQRNVWVHLQVGYKVVLRGDLEQEDCFCGQAGD